jgi:hypothetical protein
VKDKASSAAAATTEYVQSLANDATHHSQAMLESANSRVQEGFNWVLRERPLLVAATGLMVGAAAAAVFPRTEVEDQALSGAREAAVDATQKASEALTRAAGQAGEVLQERATERGLTTEGLKDLTREVATTFTEAVRGESNSPEKRSAEASPRFAPE